MTGDPQIIGLVATLKELGKKVLEQQKRRMAVENSEIFLHMKRQKELAEISMEELLQGIPDSRSTYDGVKKALIAKMKERNITKLDGFVTKTKMRKGVNPAKVYSVMGGDTDMFLSLVSITQSGLEKFAKGVPSLRDALLDCVEEQGREVSDIEEEDFLNT